MTTTSLSVSTKVWNEDHQHKQFHFYDSTPDVGTVEEGTAFTFITVDGVVIKRIEGLVSGYISTVDGAVAHCFYIDRAGNAGDWVTETFSVTNAFDRTYYVDATGGSDSNDGLSTGAPKQTLVGAITALQAAWVSGESNRILLKRGEAFDTTGATATQLWNPASYTGCITFGAYDAGARPTITLTTAGNGTRFVSGALGTCGVTLRGIEIIGGSISTGRAVSCTESVIGSNGCNLALIDCFIHDIDVCILGPSETLSRRADMDFTAVKDCTFDGYSGGGTSAIYGWDYARYVLFQDVTMLTSNDISDGFIRTVALSYSCFDNIAYDRTGGGVTINLFRINGGAGTTSDDKAHHINLHRISFLQCTEGIEIDPVFPELTYFSDIDVNACSMDSDGEGAVVKAWIVTGNSADIVRLRIRNCWHRSNDRYNGALVRLSCDTAGAQRIQSVTIEHCTTYRVFASSTNEPALLQVGTSTGVSDGALTIRNNYAYLSGATGNGAFMSCPSAKITACDYNVARKAGGTMNWNDSTNLTNWRNTTPFDDNSSDGLTATHNLTNVGFLTFDARPASNSGPQISVGLAGIAYADAAGNLWDSIAPDVGAFQSNGIPQSGPPTGLQIENIPTSIFAYRMDLGVTTAGVG